jgi:sorbitol-specific phosphotransferase system component IIBC
MVTLEAGTYAVEWHSVSTRATQATGTVTIGSAESVPFVSPFSNPGPVVLYLKRA